MGGCRAQWTDGHRLSDVASRGFMECLVLGTGGAGSHKVRGVPVKTRAPEMSLQEGNGSVIPRVRGELGRVGPLHNLRVCRVRPGRYHNSVGLTVH